MVLTVKGTRTVEHVAIIMDGNRRWAKKNGVTTKQGHNRGAKALRDVVEASLELGIKTITAYSFSTENWQRNDKEIEDLFEIFIDNLYRMQGTMKKNGVRLHTIGNIDPFPQRLKKILCSVKEVTKDGKKLDLVLALNYGSRDEVCRAVKKILEDYSEQKTVNNRFDEKVFASYLDTAGFCDPDLVIRTASESRLSNFLLYQISYSELYISDVLWPDFDKKELLCALAQYGKRKRKYGE